MIGHIRQTERQQMSLYSRKTRPTIASPPPSVLAAGKSLTEIGLKKRDRTTSGEGKNDGETAGTLETQK